MELVTIYFFHMVKYIQVKWIRKQCRVGLGFIHQCRLEGGNSSSAGLQSIIRKGRGLCRLNDWWDSAYITIITLKIVTHHADSWTMSGLWVSVRPVCSTPLTLVLVNTDCHYSSTTCSYFLSYRCRTYMLVGWIVFKCNIFAFLFWW